MCAFYKSQEPMGKEKPIVQATLKELYNYYNQKYDHLRKTDAPGEFVVRTASAKRAVLDLIDECNSCDKDLPKAKRAIDSLV